MGPEHSMAQRGVTRRQLFRASTGALALSGLTPVLAACGDDESSTSGTETLKLGALPNISDGVLHVGTTKGWYQEQGLEVSYLQFDDGHGAEAVQSLGGGNVDVAGVGSTPALLAAMNGAVDLKIVSLINNATSIFRLFANADIDDISDLAGQKVAFPEGSVWDYFIREALATADMTLDDVEPVDLPAPDAVNAFLTGRVSATSPPPALIEQIESQVPDANLVFEASDFAADQPFGVVNPIVVTADKLESSGAMVQEFLDVYHSKVVPFVLDSSTRDEAVQEVVAYIDDATGGSTDLATIDQIMAGQEFYDSSAIREFMTGGDLRAVLEGQAKFLLDTGAGEELPNFDELIDTSLLP